jgi:hypothetical protein
MPSILTCANDVDLLAVAAGEGPSEELRIHLVQCPICRERVEEFRAQMAVFRECEPEIPSAPGTISEWTSGSAPSNGHATASR